MDIKKAEQLLDRYLLGRCTKTEQKIVEDWFASLPESELNIRPNSKDRLAKAMKVKIDAQLKKGKGHLKTLLVLRIAAAVIAFFLLTAGFYFYFVGKLVPKSEQVFQYDIDPGGNKATLLLANGKKVVLDSLANGELAEEDGIRISKTDDGQLVYQAVDMEDGSKESSREEISYHEIQTPKGGQYKVILPDSSCVWLNAASSLRFPTRFDRHDRRVELKGEAYFEVSKKDKALRTFTVETYGQQVEVLGTHFNINAYPGEHETKTTLLEGSVKVSNMRPGASPKVSKVLSPGQQAQLSATGMVVKEVDPAESMAWTNNLFYFKGADLAAVMRQMERWYAIDVDYGSLPNKKLRGQFPRNAKLSVVLKTIEETSNIKFKLEGRRLMVE